ETVSVVDTSTLRLIASVPVGSYPSGVSLDAGRRRLFCGCAMSSALLVIDVDALEVIAQAPADAGAGAVAVDTRRGHVYCANFLDGSLTVVEAATGAVLEPIE